MCDNPAATEIETAEAVWSLIRAPKYAAEDSGIAISDFFSKTVNLDSSYGKKAFTPDVSKRRIELKYTMQTRYGTSTPLIRLDVNTSHVNPDVDYHVGVADPFSGIHDSCIGRKYVCESHLHIYRPGYGDRWAYPVEGVFDNTRSLGNTLLDFLDYCNIRGLYEVQEALFDYRGRGQESY